MRSRLISLFAALAFVGLAFAAVRCVGETPDVSCDQYCDEVAAACGEGTGDMATPPMQYKSRSACLAMCGGWGKGDAGRNGNTLGCRLSYANEAKEEKVTDPAAPQYRLACYNAGPYSFACGDVTPTDACQAFCRETIRHCGIGMNNQIAYSSEQDCVDKCHARFPEVKADPSASANAVAQTFLTTKNEDTLACRMFHLENAVENGNTSLGVHCAHTNVAVGAPLCGRPATMDAGADAASDAAADAGSDASKDGPAE